MAAARRRPPTLSLARSRSARGRGIAPVARYSLGRKQWPGRRPMTAITRLIRRDKAGFCASTAARWVSGPSRYDVEGAALQGLPKATWASRLPPSTSPAIRQGSVRPQKTWRAKRERQYVHTKESLLERDKPEPLAEEIAARVVNQERAQHGESVDASASSLHDMSAGRRSGLRSHRGSGVEHCPNCAMRPASAA